MRIALRDLTREHVLDAKTVCVGAGDGIAVVMRDYRKLLPMIESELPASAGPEDLVVDVPPGTREPIATVLAALQYLGFGRDESAGDCPALVRLN